MNDQIEKPVEQPIDAWNNEFRALLGEAQKRELFAPDVLFILQHAANEIEHQLNSILFNHEHKVNQEEGE